MRFGVAPSLTAAWEATCPEASPVLSRRSRASSASSCELQRNKRSQIPVKARPTQAEPRINGMNSHVQGRRSPLARGTQLERGRGPSSSPPRGLREAYERIVDEEKLAAEESALEDVGDEDEDTSRDWTDHPAAEYKDHSEKDQDRVQGLISSPSPLSLPRSGRSSPPTATRSPRKRTVADYQEFDDSTLDSASGSVISGISSLENGTEDSFAPTLAKHARDQQRINGVLKNENRVFSRARRPDGASLTSGDLRRRDKVDVILANERELARDAAAPDGELSAPPVQIPRAWGRRSRKRDDWLSKIQEAEDDNRTADGGVAGRDEGYNSGNADSNRANDSSIDWLAAAADVPLPSVEDVPTDVEKTSRPATTLPHRQQTGSLERLQQFHLEDEFIARTLEFSASPVSKPKSTVNDLTRDREIETLKGKAVTTSRLGELKERRSKEHLVSHSPLSQETELPVEDHPGGKHRRTSFALGSHERSQVQSRESHDNNDSSAKRAEEGEAGLESSVVVYKKAGAPAEVNDGASLTDITGPKEAKPIREKLEDKRTDSRDLLLQLARATSSSPSPTLKAQDTRQPVSNDVSTKRSDGPQGVSGSTSVSKREASVQKPAKESTAGKLDTMERDAKVDEDSTPKTNRQLTAVQTPALAIGGWVNTPTITNQTEHKRVGSAASNTDVGPGISALDIKDRIRGLNLSHLYRRSELNQGPSGKDGRLSGAKRWLQRSISAPQPNHETNLSGRLKTEARSRTGSLDKMVDGEFVPAAMLTAKGKSMEPDSEDKLGTLPSKAEREKYLELIAYERMNDRLQALQLSIKDAKRGSGTSENELQGTGEAVFWACPDCGHLVYMCHGEHCHQWHLRNPFPTIVRWSGWKPRLTWFGVILAIIWTYILAEWLTW